MPMTCTVCRHPRRAEIDAALVAGEALRNIAERFGTSATAVFRHKREHVAATIAKAKDAAEVSRGDDLLGRMRELAAQARRIGDNAEQKGRPDTALRALREQTRIVEVLVELGTRLEEHARNAVRPAADADKMRDQIARMLKRYDAEEAASGRCRSCGAALPAFAGADTQPSA